MDQTLFHQMAEVEGRHWWYLGRREIVARVVDSLALPRGARIVDAGCGTGGGTAFLAARSAGAWSVQGVDPMGPAIDLARRFAMPGLEYRCGTVADLLPDSEGTADLVLMLDVVEHVQDDRALVDLALRLLKPGGHLLLTVPADPNLWSPHDEAFGHHRRYEPDTLAALVSDAPVEIRLLSHFNARLYPVIRAVREVKQGRAAGGAVAAVEGSDLREYPAPVNRVLARLFAGESSRLVDALLKGGQPYRRGASLILVARKAGGAG